MRIHYFVVLFIIAFAGCEPEPDQVKLYDEFVVLTNYDTQADFKSFTTFAIPKDTIGFFSNSSNDTIIITLKMTFLLLYCHVSSQI